MKRLLISLGILLFGIMFCATSSYAVCPFPDGPYITVIKYNTGKKTVQEKWECAMDANVNGNGACFYNLLNSAGDTQYTCISGEFKILYPVND